MDFACVLSESRIIADLSDFADFKMCNNRSFVIRVLAFFCLNARRVWANTPQIAEDTENTENSEKAGFD